MTDWPAERLKKLGRDALAESQHEARQKIEELLSRERSIKAMDDLTEALEDLSDSVRHLTHELEKLREEDHEDWKGQHDA